MSTAALLFLGALAAPAHALDAYKGETEHFDSIKLSVGGHLQPHFAFSPEDEDAGSDGEVGFSIRRARYSTKADFHTSTDGPEGWTGLGFSAKMAVEHSPETRITDAFVDVRAAHPLQLRVGQFKAPMLRNHLTSSSTMVFQDRSTLEDMVPERQIGAQLFGHLGRHHVEWAAGAFNGEGTNRRSNVDRQLMYVGRVTVSPLGAPRKTVDLLLPKWTLNRAYKDDAAPDRELTFTLGSSAFRNVVGSEGSAEGSWGVAAEAFVHWKWFNVQAEWLTGATDWEDPSVADYSFGGWYAQLAMFLPGSDWTEEHLAVVGRVDQFDLLDPAVAGTVPLVGPTDENQQQRHISAGMLYFVGTPLFDDPHAVRVGLHYTIKQELEGLEYANDELLLSSQVKF